MKSTPRNVFPHGTWRRPFSDRYKTPYHFHTAILRVNKGIGTDAARYLHEQNSFIRISSFGSPGNIFSHLAEVGARIVAIRHVDGASCIAYEIHVSSPSNGEIDHFPVFRNHPRAWNHGSVKLVLILERDISKLWTTIRMANEFAPPDCVRVRSGRGEKLKLSGCALPRSVCKDLEHDHSHDAPLVKIRASHVACDASDGYRRTAFFQTACRALGGFFDVRLLDFGHGLPERPMRTPSVTLIWPSAFEWSRFDRLLALKLEADELVVAGKLWTALPKYQYAANLGIDWFDRRERYGIDSITDQESRFLQFDLTMSVALLRFHLDGVPFDIDDYTEDVDVYDDVYVRWRPTPHVSGILAHYLIITSLLFGDPLAVLDSGEYDDSLGPLYHIFKGDLSFARFPFEIMNTISDQGRNHGRPKGLVGWQDTQHLAELTEKEKKAINAYQRDHNLRITTGEVKIDGMQHQSSKE
ncbi:unnamed protein product [Zymoseptoria tritici ST99CH_1A5]|uniref:Uncharacterized protein n=1 Tax=Zymoseptoria tritici ST99CH_1A5 TaxID=1276529 RepID=A0A1Y6LEX5_ZYMTR|nr:unnamed protein product [Zymoseptoria tritici ST99CH_1A5]